MSTIRNKRITKYDIEQGIALVILAISTIGLVLIAIYHP